MEGADDRDFVNAILKAKLLERYTHVDIVPWAQMNKERRKAFVASVRAIESPYFVLIDLDTGCIAGRKDRFCATHPFVDPQAVLVSVMEIEAWYLAGASDGMLAELRLNVIESTDHVTKETFQSLVAKARKDVALTKIRLLDSFDRGLALNRNRSFAYAWAKLS